MKLKNRLNALTWVVVLSATLCFTSFCLICIRNAPLDFDWYGALIGVLSLLVTILIGWNIWSSLDFKQKIKSELKAEIDEKLSMMESEFKVKIRDEKDTAIYLSLSNIGHTTFDAQQYISAFGVFLKVASLATRLNKPEDVKESFDRAMLSLTLARKMNPDLSLSKYSKEAHISLLKLINDNRVNEVIIAISNLPTCNNQDNVDLPIKS